MARWHSAGRASRVVKETRPVNGGRWGSIGHLSVGWGRWDSALSDLRPSPAKPTIAQKVTSVAKRARAAPGEVAQPQVVRVPGVQLVKESTRTGVLWCKQPGTPYMCYPQGHVL